MSKVKLFPWPKEWKKPRPIVGFWGLVLGGFCITASLSVLWKAFVVTGDYSDVMINFLFLPAGFCLVLMSVYIIRRRRRFSRSFRSLRSTAPGETPEPGLVLKYSEAPQWCVFIFPICFMLVFIGVLCDSKLRAGRIFSIPNVIAAPLLICGVISLLILFRRLSFKGTVILTSWGIYEKRKLHDLSFPWEIVQDIYPVTRPCQIRFYNNPSSLSKISFNRRAKHLFFCNPDLLPNVAIPARTLEIDPVLALYLLRFYWIETTARAELGTPAALERLRRGDLTTQREYPPIY